MTEQRERVEKALRACAEQRVPYTADPWPVIKERALARRGRSRRGRLVPRTRVGWAFAALLVMLFGTGAYAASGVAYDLFREALPGGEGPAFGEEIGQTQTVDGASVTLEWAYADTEFVVIGYSVEDLEEDRRNAGNPAALEPIWVGKEDENVPSAPDRRSELTDDSGGDFDSIDGTATVAGPGSSPGEIRAPKTHSAVFEAPEGFETGRDHRFNLDIFLEEMPVPTSWEEAEKGWRVEEKPPIGPLTFDFEIPVHPVPVVEVNQKVEAQGITLTLERVINSPGRPQAVICIEPPNDEYQWMPSVKNTGFASDEPITPRRVDGDCWSATLGDPVEGSSSVTVTEIWGPPLTEKAMEEDEDGKEIYGPWTFEFEVPER
ncbi:MAG TPA: DUF4179 domain-containing protein [Rubrobacter sp.]|nr:DUF4179 domain-containing protein [Rubrobacter sp.]